jgi:hypothetical protein
VDQYAGVGRAELVWNLSTAAECHIGWTRLAKKTGFY